jgi:raffinose/stachyose/melibiose transport system permease protein
MFEAQSRPSRIGLQILATVMILPFLAPLLFGVQGSLGGLGLGNYAKVFNTGIVPTVFINSAIISICTIAIVYACTMPTAYGFSKLRIPHKEIWFWALLAALTVPEAVLLTPLFVVASNFDLYDELPAVILPLAALQVPFTVLIARTFFDGIPDEILEAARVDGANPVQVFLRVVLPLTRPIAAVIVVLTLISSWNSYLLPMLMLTDQAKQVVTLLPSFFTSQYTNDQTGVLAAAVMTAVPVILVYIAFQGYFQRGLAAGALK